MRPLTALDFDNRYARLHPGFFEVVDPTPLANPRLVAFNPEAARLIDLDPEAAADPEAPLYLSGARRLPGAEPVAMLYAGHQFGVWVPELGDGRAILLGQCRNGRGERWDLHLKGAGLTRYSRMGDGRAVLRSTIREYLGSEAMHGLGIPTTRALAIVGSDEVVQRETRETAATLIRLAPSHVRFGHFQVFAARRQPERVRELAEYCIGAHDSDLAGQPDRYRRWLERVVDRTAELVARWMAVGFTHGVLNTDNMSILGLTLDYGPYGWQDQYRADHVPNHTDHEGRYAYSRQPAVGLWNLARFAEALLSLVSVEEANAALERYPAAFADCYGGLMRAKLGLDGPRQDDAELIDEMLAILETDGIDYSLWFRTLGRVTAGSSMAPIELAALARDQRRLDAWVARYGARLAASGSGDHERRTRLDRINPKFVLRNHLAQGAIERAQQGDFGEIERLRAILAAPFDEHPGAEADAGPAPAWARDLVISCSS